MALVKTVYVLVHTGAQDGIYRLAAEVQLLLDRRTRDGLVAAVEKIREFWDTELHTSTLAGRAWRKLLAKAEDSHLILSDYQAKVDDLLQGLAVFLRAAD